MVTLSFGDLVMVATMLGGFATVIFYAGKLSARVDSLEEWRRAIPQQFDAIHAALRDLDKAIRGRVV